MKLRRHLRVWAALSLVVQSAWLFALVPRDCCAAHTTASPSCHEEVSATHCPMTDATGAACPMHQTGDTPLPAGDCAMRGTCSGPMSALMSLLSVQAVLTTPTHGLIIPASHTDVLELRAHLVLRATPPASPPPRA